MALDLATWHARFRQQAGWTRELRQTLLRRSGMAQARSVLEVGAATGALTGELSLDWQARVVGLDLEWTRLAYARLCDPRTCFTQADAHSLPYRSGSFDLSVCHFLLLWVRDPAGAVTEMRRVTRPGGFVLALAEPDYGSRIDFPNSLAEIGRAQRTALIEQGANPDVGRELGRLFVLAGLDEVEVGVLGAQWAGPPSRTEFEMEWSVLEDDLQASLAPEVRERLRMLDWTARERGERVLYVPTFYAIGRVE
ncbi:MAG TPA: methyltransferase domain-containing protein [Anaerolineales bacterium]|nr:methyltransferase domain-containing protein [Anaerolineales bacterium]